MLDASPCSSARSSLASMAILDLPFKRSRLMRRACNNKSIWGTYSVDGTLISCEAAATHLSRPLIGGIPILLRFSNALRYDLSIFHKDVVTERMALGVSHAIRMASPAHIFADHFCRRPCGDDARWYPPLRQRTRADDAAHPHALAAQQQRLLTQPYMPLQHRVARLAIDLGARPQVVHRVHVVVADPHAAGNQSIVADHHGRALALDFHGEADRRAAGAPEHDLTVRAHQQIVHRHVA